MKPKIKGKEMKSQTQQFYYGLATCLHPLLEALLKIFSQSRSLLTGKKQALEYNLIHNYPVARTMLQTNFQTDLGTAPYLVFKQL